MRETRTTRTPCTHDCFMSIMSSKDMFVQSSLSLVLFISEVVLSSFRGQQKYPVQKVNVKLTLIFREQDLLMTCQSKEAQQVAHIKQERRHLADEDVTNRLHFEEAMSNAKAKYGELLEQVSTVDMFCRLASDSEGTYF